MRDRTMIDRRPAPAKPVALDDAGLRAATQVRALGAETHRRDPGTGYAECGGLNGLAPWVLIRTTRPVTCRHDGCRTTDNQPRRTSRGN